MLRKLVRYDLELAARKQPYQELILEGKVIEDMKSYKLLGIHVAETLKWYVHIKAMLSKASKRIHVVKHYDAVLVCLLLI